MLNGIRVAVFGAAFGGLCCIPTLASTPAAAADACSEVPQPFVAPVGAPHAAAADALLASESVVELSDDQASALLDVARGPSSLAETMLSRAIARLEQVREAAMDRRRGSWSLADVDELATLDRLEPQLWSSAPRPFLVRAVRGSPETGSFYTRVCGDTLTVDHLSLGTKVPPSTPATIIVFLTRKPSRINARFTIVR